MLRFVVSGQKTTRRGNARSATFRSALCVGWSHRCPKKRLTVATNAYSHHASVAYRDQHPRSIAVPMREWKCGNVRNVGAPDSDVLVFCSDAHLLRSVLSQDVQLCRRSSAMVTAWQLCMDMSVCVSARGHVVKLLHMRFWAACTSI